MVGETAKNYDAMLMDRHGAVCLGSNLLEAFCRLETMEHTALITKYAKDMGGVKTLPPDEAEKLRRMGLKRYGGPPAAVAKSDNPGADLPHECLDCSDVEPPSPVPAAPTSDLRMARIIENPFPSENTKAKDLTDLVTDEVIKALQEGRLVE
tara:strand:- start:334 stop:789 length:456 start_codon:yes stop_codon:yes gene_type:complete